MSGPEEEEEEEVIWAEEDSPGHDGDTAAAAAPSTASGLAEEAAEEERREHGALDGEREEDQPSCRICHGPASPDAELLSPCGCSGTMRYVHLECLEAWRRRGPQHAVKCGVCGTAYSHVWTPPWGLAEVLYLLHWARWLCTLSWPSSWRRGGRGRASVRRLLRSKHPACSVVRLTSWALLLCVASSLGRLALFAVSALHEAVIGMDKALDPLIFDTTLLETLEQAFPALAGFGHLGVYNFTASLGEAIVANAPDSALTWQWLRQRLSSLAEALAVTFFRDPPWRLPRSWDEIILGGLCLLGVVHTNSAQGGVWFLDEVDIPSPFDDLMSVMDVLLPPPRFRIHGLLFVAPAHAYAVRLLLQRSGVLRMQDMPFHEYPAAHLALAGLAGLAHVLLVGSAELLHEDYLRWYADLTSRPASAAPGL